MMGLISVDSIPEKLTMSMKDEAGIHNLSLPDGSIEILPLEEEEESQPGATAARQDSGAPFLRKI